MRRSVETFDMMWYTPYNRSPQRRPVKVHPFIHTRKRKRNMQVECREQMRNGECDCAWFWRIDFSPDFFVSFEVNSDCVRARDMTQSDESLRLLDGILSKWDKITWRWALKYLTLLLQEEEKRLLWGQSADSWKFLTSSSLGCIRHIFCLQKPNAKNQKCLKNIPF